MARISSNIDDVIAYLEEKKKQGFKTVEVIDKARLLGWDTLSSPNIDFVYSKEAPTVVGIKAFE